MAAPGISNVPSGDPSTPLKSRKRSKTVDLESPRAEKDIKKYTKARVELAREYAGRRLHSTTRVPTPSQVALLTTYWNGCDAFLKAAERNFDADSGEEARKKFLIRNCENELHDYDWARSCTSKEEQELLSTLINMRKVTYYGRYGDWCKEICLDLRIRAKEANLPEYEFVKKGEGNWAAIGDKVTLERHDWRLYGDSATSTSVKTIVGIRNLCAKIPLDLDQTLNAIEMYGNRNKSVHNAWEELLVEPDWIGLRNLLSSDLNDMPFVCPAHLFGEKEFMHTLLEAKILKWWDVPEGSLHLPGRWTDKFDASGELELKKSRKEYMNNKEKAKAAWDYQSEQAAKNRLTKQHREELYEQAGDFASSSKMPSGSPVPSKETKRKADEAFADDMEREKAFNVLHMIMMKGKVQHTMAEAERKKPTTASATFDKKKFQTIATFSSLNEQIRIYKARGGEWPRTLS